MIFSFERKLKLHSLGQYDFSQRELECIEIINYLHLDNMTFEFMGYLYHIMNLKILKSSHIVKYKNQKDYTKYIRFFDHNYLKYFEICIDDDDHILYYDYNLIKFVFDDKFKIEDDNLLWFILKTIVEKSYNIKNLKSQIFFQNFYN